MCGRAPTWHGAHWGAGRPRAPGPAAAEEEPTPTADFPGLVDLVEDGGAPAFLLRDGSGLRIAASWTVDGRIVVPPPRESIPWLLPRAAEVLRYVTEDTDARLWADLEAHHRAASDLPAEEDYTAHAAWDIHTHLPEPANYSGMLGLVATGQRGKSKQARASVYVARRGVITSSLREANLIRYARDLGATLGIEVRRFWKKAEESGTEDLFLNRWERGAKVGRVLYPDRGPYRDLVHFGIFGPTYIATNEEGDDIQDSRCLLIRPRQSARKFDLAPITEESCLPLRERLVALRARHLGETPPAAPKPAEGRLGDITRTLLQVVRWVRPDREAALLRFVAAQEGQDRTARASSLEAEVLGAVVLLRESVERGILPVATITTQINMDRPETERLTPHRIARLLWALGFSRGSTASHTAALIWDVGTLEVLAGRYGVELPEGWGGVPPAKSPEAPKAPEPPEIEVIDPGLPGETGNTGLSAGGRGEGES